MKQSRKPHNEWLKRISTGDITLPSTFSAPNGTATPWNSFETVTYYTLDDVAQHNQIHDAWMVIGECVFDVTEYMDYHPGGSKELMKGIGKDATEMIRNIHPWVNLPSILRPCYRGKLRSNSSSNGNNHKEVTHPSSVNRTYIFPSVLPVSSLSSSSSSTLTRSTDLTFRNNTVVSDTTYRATQSHSLCIYANPNDPSGIPYYATWYPDNLLRFTSTKGNNGLILIFSVKQFLQCFRSTATPTGNQSKRIDDDDTWYKFLSSAYVDRLLPLSIRIIIDTIGYKEDNESITQQCLTIVQNWLERTQSGTENSTTTPLTVSSSFPSIQYHITILSPSSSEAVNLSIRNTEISSDNSYIHVHQILVPSSLYRSSSSSSSMSSSTIHYRYWDTVMDELLSRQYIHAPHAELLCLLFPDTLFNVPNSIFSNSSSSSSILHNNDNDDMDFVGVEDKEQDATNQRNETSPYHCHDEAWLESIDNNLRKNYYLASNTLIVVPRLSHE